MTEEIDAQAYIGALTEQRNSALDAVAVARAKQAKTQYEITVLRSKVKELEEKLAAKEQQ